MERKVKWSRPAAVSEKREERREEEGSGEGVLSDQVCLCAHKHDPELVTLFDVSRDTDVILPSRRRRRREEMQKARKR